jgi:hypothetical protein
LWQSSLAGVHYVDVNSTNATPPYTNWPTAATNIQDAVDAAVAGDEIVVTNGTYAPVTVLKPIAMRSINGPLLTTINGGGGAWCVYLATDSSLSGFTLTNGHSFDGGGGVWCGSSSAVVSNCVLTGNWADEAGGGAYGGTLNNCTLTGNYATHGGGAIGCTLNNCTLSGNSAFSGGGADSCALNNCTLTGNSADGPHASGGGAADCTLTNCIAYFNSGANYDQSCTLNYCCTTPLPASGVGNISSDPQLASASHLSALSPCIGKGYYPAASGTDIDGERWANPPSMGCDEYHAGDVTGPLNVAISTSFTNVAVGFPVDLTARIEGRAAASSWDFGDGATATNQPYTSHAWAAPGDYAVVLRAYNESQPGGISATVTVDVVNEVHYVVANNVNPVAPYTTWATAATNIQDAANAAMAPGALVLVTNGTYGPISIFNSVAVRSVNGPQFTTINGGGSSRCVYLTNSASLYGFTLTNGYSIGGGGGAYGGTLNNCMLTGNSAFYYGGNSAFYFGGGAAYSTLNNCTLIGNRAYATVFGQSILVGISGGGAAYSTLNNCTLIGNRASATVGGNDIGAVISGGGAYGCTLHNCILIQNVLQFQFTTGTGSAPVIYDGPDYSSCTANNCWTNDPLFVSGSLRLQSNSPCINAGNNAYAPGPDLDGNPRMAGGTVDIGAYEYQTPTSIISYAWLQQYGLLNDGSADFADPDHDGMNNWQEWICGTDPTNALSALRLLTPLKAGTNVTLTWQSVAGMNYFLERSSGLTPPAFAPLATNVFGQVGTTSFTDTNAVGAGPFFYRVGVGN